LAETVFGWREPMRFFAILLVLLGLIGPAAAQNLYSSLTIDSSELASKATRRFADVAARGVNDGMRRELSGRLGKKGAPRLIIRLKSVMLTSDEGGRRRDRLFNDRRRNDVFADVDRFFDEPPGEDNLIGEALIVSPKGKVLQRIPMFNALKPQRWILQRADQWPRVVRLGQDFGYWLARKL
jgi:hypothetical protein